MKGKIKLSELQENSEFQIYVSTRMKGHYWRDEIDDEGIFHFIASSIVNCSSVFDENYWQENFSSFEGLRSPLSFNDYYSTQNILNENFSVFHHKSIHVLHKAWEFFSKGGDSFSQAEISCKGRTYKKSRIFTCKNYHIGTGVFILDGEEWSEHESIFMNNTHSLKISELQFSNLLDIVHSTIEAGSSSSSKIMTGYIEKNFDSKIPNEYLDVQLYNHIKTARPQRLDDVFK